MKLYAFNNKIKLIFYEINSFIIHGLSFKKPKICFCKLIFLILDFMVELYKFF